MENNKRIFGYRSVISDIPIIERTEAAYPAHQKAREHWGASIIVLKPGHIKALQDGKMLAWGKEKGCCEFVMLERKGEEED